MPRYLVIRDFGFDVAGRHFVHGEQFDSSTLFPDLPADADDERKKAQLAAKAAAERLIQEGLKNEHGSPQALQEAEEEKPVKAAASSAKKEG